VNISIPNLKTTAHPGIFQPWRLSNLSRKQFTGRTFFLVIVLAFFLISGLAVIEGIKWVGQNFAGFLITPRIVVANNGLHYWSGMKAGLKYPDKILSANGQNISSIGDLKNVIKATKVGDPILFTVDRNGEKLEVAIPTARFSWLDLSATFGLEFLSGLTFFIIGVVVFILKPDVTVSWSFLLLCFFLSLYNITDFDKASTGFARIYILAMAFIPAAGIHLSLFFPERRKIADRFPYLNCAPYALSAALFIPLVILYPQPSFRPFYQLSLLYLVLAALCLVLSTLQSYIRSASVLARQRGKVILFGAALAFPLPAIVHYVSFFGSNANLGVASNFLPLPIVVFPLSIAYAIVRHNLFDVDAYIKRAVGYGIMTAILGIGYLSVQTVTNTFVLRPLFGSDAERIYPILFALLVVFLFNPINQRVQLAIDRLFFRKQLDYKETVRNVSHVLASLLNLDQILERVVQTLRKEMFIDTVGVFVFAPQRSACRSYFASDDSTNAIEDRRDVRLQTDDPLIALVSRKQKLITKYDIEEDPQYTHVKESCRDSFSRISGSLAIPLIYQGKVTGILTLGHKKSGHFYTREDIDLLDTMANEAAVAIENAKLAEQMKKEEGVRANLSRYLSPQIVDQIVKNDVQVNLGGDKKVVTVLFSDIRNFTTITESYPPDQLVRILNEYFTEMAGIIFKNQGSLDKYIGDAIVAVFGSLIDLKNSAQHAIQAAIQMMRRLSQLNEKWIKEYGFKMEIGIGINTGEVFLGNIGSPDRMEFTVIGDAVNVASRFSGLAKPGQVLITRDTLACLDSHLRCCELPATEVKGKTGKLQVFEVLE
jgi:class 3 adenylate cyclase